MHTRNCCVQEGSQPWEIWERNLPKCHTGTIWAWFVLTSVVFISVPLARLVVSKKTHLHGKSAHCASHVSSRQVTALNLETTGDQKFCEHTCNELILEKNTSCELSFRVHLVEVCQSRDVWLTFVPLLKIKAVSKWQKTINASTVIQFDTNHRAPPPCIVDHWRKQSAISLRQANTDYHK